MDSRLVGNRVFRFHESRRCSRDTFQESYIAECTLIYEEKGVLDTLSRPGKVITSLERPLAGNPRPGNSPQPFRLNRRRPGKA